MATPDIHRARRFGLLSCLAAFPAAPLLSGGGTGPATTRVSVDSSGSQANNSSFKPSISANGRNVAFWSVASNLVPDDTNAGWDVFVHRR